MSTTEIGRPNGKLVLPGADSSHATVEVIYQSYATRVSRAVITLAVAILISPVLFFLPPHFLWPVVAIAVGGWLAWRYWTGEYYVTHFEGICPRCETPLEMARGTRIRGEHTLDCHGCHRHPTLIVNDPEHPPEGDAEADVVRDEASDRRAPARERRNVAANRRDTAATPTSAPEAPSPAPEAPSPTPETPAPTPEEPAPTTEEPTAVLDEPAVRRDELGG